MSFWWTQVGRGAPRAPLRGDTSADVCIVGAGYTGLWTAYHLKQAAPHLRVVLVETRFAGFGASGRNGGWLTNAVTGGREQYVTSHGREAAQAQQDALTASVHDVIDTLRRESIDADVHLGGELVVARTLHSSSVSRRPSTVNGAGPEPTSVASTLTRQPYVCRSPMLWARRGTRTVPGFTRRSWPTASPTRWKAWEP